MGTGVGVGVVAVPGMVRDCESARGETGPSVVVVEMLELVETDSVVVKEGDEETTGVPDHPATRAVTLSGTVVSRSG